MVFISSSVSLSSFCVKCPHWFISWRCVFLKTIFCKHKYVNSFFSSFLALTFQFIYRMSWKIIRLLVWVYCFRSPPPCVHDVQDIWDDWKSKIKIHTSFQYFTFNMNCEQWWFFILESLSEAQIHTVVRVSKKYSSFVDNIHIFFSYWFQKFRKTFSFTFKNFQINVFLKEKSIQK